MRSVLVLAVLVGCKGGGVEIGEDTDDTDVADTDTTDDTDVVDTDDTETDDTTDTFELGGTLEVGSDVEVPTGAVSVGLVHLVGDFGFGEVLQQVEVSGLTAGGSVPFQFHLPDLDDGWYQPMEGTTSGEMALFFVGAWQDTDGDDVPAEGDVFVGGSLSYLAHLRGEVSTEVADLGGQLGWNVVILDVTGTGGTEIVPIEDGYADYLLEANLLPVPQDDLPGEIVPSLGGAVGAGLYSVVEYFGGTAPADPTLTSMAVLANTANTTFLWPGPLGEPPEDHFSRTFGDGEDVGVDIAAYLGIAWSDADNDGDWDASTEVPRAISSDAGAEARMALYLRARDFRAVYFPEAYGWNMGWLLIRAEDGADPTPEPWTDGLVLDVAR